MTIATNTPINQIKDYMKYERKITGPYAKLLNSSDVELESLEMSSSDWETLIQEDEETEVTVSGKTWEYKHLSYETAKELFDNTVAVEISGLELQQVKENSAAQFLSDDDDLKDLKDAAETADKLLEAEKELMKALF